MRKIIVNMSFVMLVLALVTSSITVLGDERDRDLKVATYNMYLGTDFTEIIQSGSQQEVFAEVAEAYGEVQSSNPAERISSIADQIVSSEAQVVGLQEVALWRSGTAFDPNQATIVEYDFLDLLLEALEERGVHYTPVSVQTGFDAEIPGIGAGFFGDLRYTDRNVILVKADAKTSDLKVLATQTGTFDAALPVNTAVGPITILRGWAAVDIKQRGKTYRVIDVHTEAYHPFVQYLQAGELLAGPATTNLPVIIVGDLNADAEANGASYLLALNAGFKDVWEETNPTDPGYTWPLFFSDPAVSTTALERLDLILFRGDLSARSAEILGEAIPGDLTTSGLRPSDHAGLSAELILKP